MTQNTLHIAFIGFGEVGQTFSRDLLAHDGTRVSAHDVLFGSPRGSAIAARATALGVTMHGAANDAGRGAEIVFSAVTASEAETVAREAATWLQPGQLFLDVNSAAPATKQRSAAHVERSGAQYIECAVMQPVRKPGIAVPILAGGPHAEKAAALLARFGMDMTPVSEAYGRAAAMKLCRSIVIKGLEALMVDCAAACEAHDVKAQVFASLSETFPSIDWPVLAGTMRERVATHGVRRSAEMREAAEMLADAGLQPDLAEAIAAAQLRGAAKGATTP